MGRSNNFLRLFAVCVYIFNFLRLLARRILNFLRFELLVDKPQLHFFLPLACSCGARTSCATSCACIIFGLYCSFTTHFSMEYCMELWLCLLNGISNDSANVKGNVIIIHL